MDHTAASLRPHDRDQVHRVAR